VSETSEINGNIYSPTVTLREGAKFNGKIDMSGQERPNVETPVKTEQRDSARAEAAKSAERKDSSEKKQAVSAA
jgi:cytoskeletal protein CcmA (bactofilin family)